MDFSSAEDHEQISSAVTELAGRFDSAYWEKCDRDHEFPWDFYNAFAEAGWVGIAIPEQYGGGGLGLTEAGLMMQQIAASGAAMNGCSAIHLSVFGVNIVTKHGSPALREQILPQVASGQLHTCFAVTEPDAGTDTSRIRTRAQRDGDHYVINGRKVWISKAGQSQKAILVARTSPREASRPMAGLSVFLIDLDAKQVQMNPIPKMGRNAVTSYELTFDDLRVPAERLIGEEGTGFRVLLDGLNPERILLAHESVGIGRASVRLAVEYAKQREVFDRPIGQNQAIAFPLAEAMARLDAAELLCQKAAWLYDHGKPCGREANAAKFLAADTAFFAADHAVQTLGGMGYADEYPASRYFREARVMRIAPVSQELALAYLAQNVLKLPKSY